MPGHCLCVDPYEIAAGGEDDFLPLKRVLELIEDNATPIGILEAALGGTNLQDEDRFVVDVFGYTYGDFVPGTFIRANTQT